MSYFGPLLAVQLTAKIRFLSIVVPLMTGWQSPPFSNERVEIVIVEDLHEVRDFAVQRGG